MVLAHFGGPRGVPEASWAGLGASREALGSVLGPLGLVLGGLGASWWRRGASWRRLGPSWGELGRALGPSRVNPGGSRGRLGSAPRAHGWRGAFGPGLTGQPRTRREADFHPL